MADFWEQFADAPITTQTNNNSSDNFWEQFESPASQTDLGKLGKPTEMRATPKRNLLMDFKNCLDWVNKTTLAAYQEGKNQTEIARLEMKDMLNINNQQEANRLEELGRISNKTYQDFGIIDNNFADNNADTKIANLPNNIKKAYIEAVKQLPIMWETIKAGGIGLGVGAVGGAGVGTATGLLTTKANTPQLALQGARVGGAWGGRITGGMKIAEIEGGLARNELKQINQEIIEKGGEPLDKWQIDTLSLAVGGINGGLEYIGLRQVLKTVPGGDKIIEYLEKKNLRELATNKAVREQLKGILGQYAETVATEVSTEMLQETMNIVADETARKLGKVDNTPLEQNVARIIQTGKVTFGATMFLGGTTSAAKATTILAKQGMTKTEAEQAVENMTPQEIDEVVENNLDTLFKSVEDIPTVKEQEDKTKLRDAYFEQIKNTGMEETEALNNATLMSEAFAALAKNTGVNLDDIEKEANIVIQNMSDKQAQQQYETDNSAALSGSITFNDTQENLIETELGRLYEEFSSLPEDYADETDLMNRISNMQILEDLQNGVISEENIQAIQNIISEYEKTNPELATFLKDAAEKVGNILGLNEIEYQKIEQPKYQKIETAGAENNETALARQEWKKKGTESKYFKKWFGDSKVVDEDGKPLVVYHGTRDVFDTFDVNKKGKASDTARVGFWFSDRENFAENFARDIWWGEQEKPVVMPVYISMQNPKIYEKKSISKEELNAARDKVDEIENKIKELNQQFNKIVQETGSFYKATEAVEKPRELLKAELKEAKNVYAELRYSDPYEQLRTDIRKMEGGNAEDANFGGLGMVLKDPESVERFVDKLKKEGYDGIIIKGTHFDSEAAEADNNNQYAVFYPEQIKSVNNRGTFDAENPNIYYQLIGENGAERYSGDAIQDLEEAKQLETKGWHQNRIFEKTGWIKGADNKWRYEISDNDAEITRSEENLRYKELPTDLLTYEDFNKKLTELNERLNKLVAQKSMNEILKSDFEEQYYGTMDERTQLIKQYDIDKERQYANRYYLDEILKHDKLFKAYPRLHTLVIEITKDEPFKAAAGVFKGNNISIADRVVASGRLKEVLMHEIQHYIQDAEDFNWGGNPECVERQIRYALNAVEKTETEQKRKDLIAMAEEESKDRFVIGAALQTLRMHEKEEALFKSWWWSKYGSWYIPRKTRKKEYRSFMNEWTQKYLTSMWDIMKERGQEAEYRKYLDMDINEVRRLYRNIDAKINRIWKRTPRDIAHNFRRALDKIENTEGEYSLSQLKIELYKQLAGEVEARNTVSRMNMTDEERRQKSPKYTQDIEDNFQLVVFSDGSTLSYSAAAQYDAAKSDNVEQAKIYFQSAYHGTPHKFDRFSTDNIGTGEGFQAHGWGLYFAEDKRISEEYREKLTYGQYDKVLYNGEEITDTNTIRRLKKIYDTPFVGKQSVIDELNKAINGKQERINSYTDKNNTLDDNPVFTESDKKSLREQYAGAIKNLKEEIKDLKEQIEFYNNIDSDKIIIQHKTGQLFEVDIPENDVLLDEDKKFSEQPKKVQEVLQNIPIQYFNPNDYNLEEMTGEDIYGEIVNNIAKRGQYIGSQREFEKAASQLLNKYGIKGITYDGRQDGRCYVIFDDKAIDVLKTYYQDMNDDVNSNINNARGFTYQRKNFDGTEKENLIVLLNKKADKSTLMHEFAHVYLITLNNLAQHNDRAKELLMTVNQWLHYDGVEYTEFQHERFANNFVAYVKSGRAPSYGLKKVFENFRRWLNDMYSELQESENVFIDPETAKVFDELLGNITINFQKEQAEQIYQKARTNAQLRYANELESQKEKVNINQLTDYQKRYRDTAYDILWYALNNSKKEGKPLIKDKRQLYMLFGQKQDLKKNNKGVIKQAEKLAEFLAELDDVFSAGDGMLPEWREFFKDTITEDSDDAALAMQALDVIVNRDYIGAYPFEYDEHGNLSEGDIAETNYALDVLIEEYKNTDDKTIPLLAFNQFMGHVHLYIQEDIQKKWENATNEIDRYEALDNFEKAKEDLKLYAATLKGYGDYSTQFAEYARKIVKRLDFMTESDKGKLFDKLKEFNSFRDIERNLDDVMDYAKTLADVSDRRALAEQIDKEVRQTIHTWQNGIKKTKYTYPANKLFERLREINKMSSSTVQDMYDAYLNEEETPDYTDDTVHEKEYYSLIEELFVKYKINGVYYSSTEFLQDLLQRLQNAKYTAKIARDEIDFERRMKRLNKVDECAKALNERKSEIEENSAIKKVGKLNAAGFNFNGALKMIFNDSIKDWASLDYLYAKRDAQVGKDRKEFLEKAKKIFGYSGKFGDVKLFNRFIDMTQKYYTITQRHSPDIEQGSYRITSQMPETGFNATQYTQQVRQDMEFADEWKPMQVELSKMEVLYYYIQAKNPTSYVILTDKDKGQFDKYDFNTMLDSLTEQEKLLGDIMQLAAEKYWNALNAYHVKKYHTDLGKVKGYFPRLSDTQDVKMLDMFNDYVAQTSNGKFQKQRTAGPGIRIKSANALAVLFDHIEKANTVITMGEHLDDINAVFSNPDLKKLMENIWGENITKEFYGQLTGNLFTGQTLTKSLQEKWYGSVISNLIKTNLFLKPQIGIKQLISFMNYGKGDEYVSPEEWWSKFTKQALTPSEWKKNIDFMMENDYLKDRFYRGGSMDALKKDLDTRFFSKLSLLDEFWSKPIQLGDIGAIILGGKPYIDALMDKGYTKEQAFRIFIETTVNDQQSSIPSTLSNMQRNASKNPLAKMAFAYQNTPWQYYRQCTNAIMKALQTKEKPDIKRATKMLVLYGWLFPALFNMASSLSLLTFMGGGGDDDLLKDINPLRTITSVLTQHPILGEWIKGVLNATEGKQYYSNDLITKHVKSINKLIRDFKKDKLTLKDFWDCLIAFSESAGVPLGSLSNAVSGIFDVIQGDIMKGTLKTLGYSDYKAKIVTGEE